MWLLFGVVSLVSAIFLSFVILYRTINKLDNTRFKQLTLLSLLIFSISVTLENELLLSDFFLVLFMIFVPIFLIGFIVSIIRRKSIRQSGIALLVSLLVTLIPFGFLYEDLEGTPSEISNGTLLVSVKETKFLVGGKFAAKDVVSVSDNSGEVSLVFINEPDWNKTGTYESTILATKADGTKVHTQVLIEVFDNNQSSGDNGNSSVENPDKKPDNTVISKPGDNNQNEKEPEKDTPTLGQSNAVAKAKDYLNFTSFSRNGLISQLEFEGFSTEEATYGVDNVVVNWNEQAKLNAIQYLNFSPFSKKGLSDQLLFEEFTSDQVAYAISNIQVDWDEQAALKAQDYLDVMSFSRSGLIEQLLFEGFTQSQAEYGVSKVGY